jgi:hypothetical protein
MQLETLHNAKELVLEGTTLLTLSMACFALVLIEFWGIKKIWTLVFK